MDISLPTILAAVLPALAVAVLAVLFVTLALVLCGGRQAPRLARPGPHWAKSGRHGRTA